MYAKNGEYLMNLNLVYPYFEPEEINYRIYGYDKSYKAISIAKKMRLWQR